MESALGCMESKLFERWQIPGLHHIGRDQTQIACPRDRNPSRPKFSPFMRFAVQQSGGLFNAHGRHAEGVNQRQRHAAELPARKGHKTTQIAHCGNVADDRVIHTDATVRCA